MSKKKEVKKTSGNLINLGDPEFNKKLFIYYGWSVPAGLLIIAGVLLYGRAYLTGILILVLCLYALPINKFRKNLSKPVKAIIVLGIIFLALMSTYLYF
jgi:hypothetical protein